ncbi:MAG TPA: hypothetical protein VFM54_18795 [Micromonosporaceae bacterium]|nr:hypothetical protein [Micromonosporaceae bacterium]
MAAPHACTEPNETSGQLYEGDPDLKEKLDLAAFSYGEVLDATKHQDDKIGRMFTSVAFLTAATLALAALGSATYVTRDFDVGPFRLPLGLVALGVFLIGVVFTVLLLLTSLATPLRVPGIGENSTNPRRRNQVWVRGVPASQLYFYEISKVSLAEWESKWAAPAADLQEERLESLVRETHNLGVRTTFKYDRSTEATAVLSYSLLAFGLAVLFIAIAAGAPGTGVVQLSPLHRCLVGAMFGCYCGLQLLARIRYAHQAIDETSVPRDASGPARFRLSAEKQFVLAFATFVLALVLYDRSWPPLSGWIAAVVILGFASIWSFWVNAAASRPGRPQSERRRRRTRRNRLVMTTLTTAVTVAAVLFATAGWYAFQLLLAALVILFLVASSAITPTLAFSHRRREYRDRATSGVVKAGGVESASAGAESAPAVPGPSVSGPAVGGDGRG